LNVVFGWLPAGVETLRKPSTGLKQSENLHVSPTLRKPSRHSENPARD